MRTWLRDNLAIAVGIALPVVVVVLFAAASVVPRWLTAPPQHDLLVTYADRSASRTTRVNVEIDVVGGRARARVYQPDDPRLRVGQPVPRLFRYAAESGQVREIPFDLPADAESLPSGSEIEIAALEGVEISALLESPDGYVFQGARRRSRNLFGDLFGARTAAQSVLVKKGAAIVEIRLPVGTPYYYAGNVAFLGWVTDE